MKTYLEIGKIVGVHGIHGDVKVDPWCDDPAFFCAFDTLYLGDSNTPVTIAAARVQKNQVICHLQGVDDRDTAETYRGQILRMHRDQAELPERTYFVQDLLGLRVVDADTDADYGKLTDVLQTGANDVYEVTKHKASFLLPAIPEVIVETDIEGGVMRVRLPEGLLDED